VGALKKLNEAEERI